MGADNWTICPKCLHHAQREADRTRDAVMALYGNVSVRTHGRYSDQQTILGGTR